MTRRGLLGALGGFVALVAGKIKGKPDGLLDDEGGMLAKMRYGELRRDGVFLDGERAHEDTRVALDGVDISNSTYNVDRRGPHTRLGGFKQDSAGMRYITTNGFVARKELAVAHHRVVVRRVAS